MANFDTSSSSARNRMPIKTVAIVGGGPAGSATATFLAKAGVKVALFMDQKRPELVIGESLIPGVIPVLDALGVEDEVAAIGTYKPGATIYFTPEFEETFAFNVLEEPLHQYAFNVPRDLFDKLLLDNAVRHGATLFPFNAKVESDAGTDTVRLSQETLDQTSGFFGDGPPDLLIDASGRARVFARLLGIKEEVGPRKDTALFAHRDKASIERRGNIHLSIFPEGWSWRIPLPGRISVGIVAPQDYLDQFGADATEQYDGALAADPILAPTVAGSKRLTKVMKYNNYQLTSDRMHGENWVMVGDAAGFIDPVFSSGLCVSLTGAQDLAEAIATSGFAEFADYERRTKHHLNSWRRVVNSFYDKGFYQVMRQAREVKKQARTERLHSWYRTQVSRVIGGVQTRNPELLEAYTSLIDEVREMQRSAAA